MMNELGLPFDTYRSHRAEPYFSFVKDGRKTIEGRIRKGKYCSIKPGDHIVVSNEAETDSVEVLVTGARAYGSFREMLTVEPLEKVLPDVLSVDEGVTVYRKFYTEEMEDEYGVIAIEVNLMPDERKLNVVDEDGNIVGVETRENIHKLGLLHREVNVWFYTPEGKIIFQHRSIDKDTFPGLLDATAAGHVEIGDDFEDTAIKETKEETGVDLSKGDISLMRMDRYRYEDSVTGMVNNSICAVYAYCFHGRLDELSVEQGAAIGFEIWPLQRIFAITDEDKTRLIPTILKKENIETFEEIRSILAL